jgi:hypothetical protein
VTSNGPPPTAVAVASLPLRLHGASFREETISIGYKAAEQTEWPCLAASNLSQLRENWGKAVSAPSALKKVHLVIAPARSLQHCLGLWQEGGDRCSDETVRPERGQLIQEEEDRLGAQAHAVAMAWMAVGQRRARKRRGGGQREGPGPGSGSGTGGVWGGWVVGSACGSGSGAGWLARGGARKTGSGAAYRVLRALVRVHARSYIMQSTVFCGFRPSFSRVARRRLVALAYSVP